ncbi:hypothetical protein ASC64_03440 [Nocardioides sp. Root122]|uniref:UvrD-helicase domain-containing protein n=1 Tax=Nocardioides TaxID=1839 RepID=UPI00070330D3|nr:MULTISPECIES: UvrD-helicase domain-containing protein [Nocardioides]KQV77883.1 hypothetical protein ASC64_03440 [Nocardioides sp. Root122]MCK9822364.1 UvrD-helicase domain-containing protein [Nocardioides cavernae]
MAAHPDLPFEQAKNKEYLVKLQKKLQRNPLQAVARNVLWIDHVDYQIKAAGYHHPLLGRVGCETDEEDLRDFYIGSRYIDDGDIRVYSWAAPIARLFFQPDSDGSDTVVVRRTFAHKNTEVSDVDDDWAREDAPSPFVRRGLNIPAPAPTTTRRRTAAPREPVQPSPTPSDAGTNTGAPVRHTVATAAPDARTARARKLQDISEGMRAKNAVIKRLAAPREERLLSVLALLQPDQHELTSWPADRDLVVQGHPGTGKTVVAAYRAAYLVNPALYESGAVFESRADRPLRVLVVGPTPGYVNHVRGLIEPLAPANQVKVTSITELLIETTGMKGPLSGALAGNYDDVDGVAANLAEMAARMLPASRSQQQVQVASSVLRRSGKSAKHAPRDDIKSLYELLRSNGAKGNPLSTDREEIDWMRRLPPFDTANQQRRYLPLLAQCNLAAKPIREAERFDHIIVDEAQDVSPIEWTVLRKYMRGGGRWTLVGDMNQRRSDVTYSSWRQIADHLFFTDPTDAEPRVMVRGYRSTGAILRFADRLLPAKERGNQTVQEDGEPVGARRITKAADLAGGAVEKAEGLAKKHSSGSTAIITVAPQELMRELGRHGWRRPGASQQLWKKGGMMLHLHVPESARGLEFDAVLVVEPGAFPTNLGRTGPLYTSLTRANRELAVVWHREPPEGLKRALRS